MRLLKIELSGEYETYGEGYFYQDENPADDVVKKIWNKRKEGAFLIIWEVNDKSGKSDRRLLDCLESPDILALNSAEELKSWIHTVKQRNV